MKSLTLAVVAIAAIESPVWGLSYEPRAVSDREFCDVIVRGGGVFSPRLDREVRDEFLWRCMNALQYMELTPLIPQTLAVALEPDDTGDAMSGSTMRYTPGSISSVKPT